MLLMTVIQGLRRSKFVKNRYKLLFQNRDVHGDAAAAVAVTARSRQVFEKVIAAAAR